MHQACSTKSGLSMRPPRLSLFLVKTLISTSMCTETIKTIHQKSIHMCVETSFIGGSRQHCCCKRYTKADTAQAASEKVQPTSVGT
jgi:hypothetical protein